MVPGAPRSDDDGLGRAGADLGDAVELDEVYAGVPPRQKWGGGPTNVPSGRGPRRPLVLTAATRGGETRFRVIQSHGKGDIGPAVRQMLQAAGTFMTDTLPAYSVVGADRRSVKHSDKEFARTDPDGTAVHMNTAESCHADLRRMVLGVHPWISRCLPLSNAWRSAGNHLDRYLEDLAFCRSLRKLDIVARLRAALASPGRLSYRNLIARG